MISQKEEEKEKMEKVEKIRKLANQSRKPNILIEVLEKLKTDI